MSILLRRRSNGSYYYPRQYEPSVVSYQQVRRPVEVGPYNNGAFYAPDPYPYMATMTARGGRDVVGSRRPFIPVSDYSRTHAHPIIHL